MKRIPVLMPHMGQSITEGSVVKWHKAVGEAVNANELVVEVESDKVTFEVGSPVNGVLRACAVEEGETAAVGSALGAIETDDVTAGEQNAIAAEPSGPAAAEDTETASAPAPAAELPGHMPSLTDDWLSPSVARLALRHGVSMAELGSLRGSGRGERVTRHDLLDYLSHRPVAPPPALATTSRNVDVEALKQHGRVVPMSAIRRSIADHMVQSIHTSAHVTMVHALDVTALVGLREGVKDAFRQRHGTNLTYTAIMIFVVGRLLPRFPIINASTYGSYILQRDMINVGCAVALPDESLVVPIIRDADTRTCVAIACDLDRLVRLARNRELSRDDVEGGTFTISNFGTFGTLFGTPIINQPQVAILGMGAIAKQPVPDGDGFRFRDTLYLSFSFDHRVIDGAMAGRFLQGFQERVDALTLEDLTADADGGG